MECELHGYRLRVYKNGMIEKWSENNWIIIKQSTTTRGYKNFGLSCNGKKKSYLVHRVIAFVYLLLDINNPITIIDHIDRDKKNNHIDNLRLSNANKNQWNNAGRGYYYMKSNKRWRVQIGVYNKIKHIGCFDTEEEAHNAYLEAKKIYHVQ